MAAQGSSTNHVFISYSREDQPYVRRLADNLRERGFEIWMDDRIDFGDSWWREIVKAVRASAALVVVMTPDSEESEWVEREIRLAQREGKPIFPLLLRGQENPLLITTHYVDVTDGQMPPGEFYEQLAQVAPAKAKAEPVDPRREDVLSVIQPEAVAPAEGAPREELPKSFEPELIRIPAGEFLMGSTQEQVEQLIAQGLTKEWAEWELPQHPVYVPDYHIAKTPVTNAQYLAFVQATGQQPPQHWKKGKPPKGKKDHPVVGVTWHDAVAYCQWLAEATGKAYGLPSEAEWEKAARGTDGRIYPWGNEWDEKRCNSREGGPGDTTPVGQYSPVGDSPYGCVDMAGNVLEWCSSLRKPYPYDPKDGREDAKAEGRRALRGGSWYDGQGYARVSSRYFVRPGNFSSLVGFRVVVAPVFSS